MEYSDERRDENMMLPPEAFIGSFADSSYEELIVERDGLIEAIRKYEENEKNGDRSGSEWNINPSPDVVYQCNMEYLAQLCLMMQEKYNQEYVLGDKRLDK